MVLEDCGLRVTPVLVRTLSEQLRVEEGSTNVSPQCLKTAASLLLDVVCAATPPQFLTSHLSDSFVFKYLAQQNNSDLYLL